MSRLSILTLITILLVPVLAAHAQDYLVDVECATWDSLNNRYLVSCYSAGDIVAIDTSGSQSMFVNRSGLVLSNCIGGNTIYVSTGTSVFGYDLTTADQVFYAHLPTSNQLDGMTTDTSGNLYVLDYTFSGSDPDRIYQIRLSDSSVSEFVNSGLASHPQDVVFDEEHNRLLLVAYAENSPIQAVSLDDTSLTDLVITPMGYLDGIAEDNLGNYYISCYTNGSVYRYESTFTNPPELVSSGHTQSSNIGYNPRDHILAVPEFAGDTVIFVQMGLPKVAEHSLSDATYGDGDGIMEPDETIELVISMFNSHFLPLTDVSIDLTGVSGGLSVVDGHADLGSIPARSNMGNSADPLVFSIPSDHTSQMDSFFVDVTFTSDYGSKTKSYVIVTGIGEVSMLLIDDSPAPDAFQYYFDDLVRADQVFTPWTVSSAGAPSLEVLSAYDIVFWFTGEFHADALQADEIAAMAAFMDGGGNLLLSGQGLADQLTSSNPDFLHDYLKAEYLRTVHYPYVVGEAAGQVFAESDSISFTGGATNQTVSDRIQPVSGGVAELRYYNDVDWGAVSYDGAYRMIFLSFSYESILNVGTQWTHRDVILDEILGFFDWINPYHCCAVPGDIDYDGNGPNIADLIYLVAFMFQEGPDPVCAQNADIDGDGEGPNIADLIYLVTFMFQEGPSLVPCP